MAVTTTGLALAALFTTSVGTAASISEQRQAGKAQERGQDKAQRKADLQSARSRRQQVREARIKRADILATSANTGAAGSSSEAGAIGSLQTQLGTNLQESFQTERLSRGISANQQQAADHQSKAGLFDAAAGVSSSFVDTKSIFK